MTGSAVSLSRGHKGLRSNWAHILVPSLSTLGFWEGPKGSHVISQQASKLGLDKPPFLALWC